MATKKKKSKSDSSTTVKADAKKLRSELASAEAKRDRWKKRAVTAEAAAADLRARLTKVEKKLERARKADVPATAASSSDGSPAAAGLPAPSTAEVPATPGASDGKPDAGWTVAELRAEARRRGIAGVSRKPKAELLAALA